MSACDPVGSEAGEAARGPGGDDDDDDVTPIGDPDDDDDRGDDEDEDEDDDDDEEPLQVRAHAWERAYAAMQHGSAN